MSLRNNFRNSLWKRRFLTASRLLISGKIKDLGIKTVKFLKRVFKADSEITYPQWRKKWVELDASRRNQIDGNILSLPSNLIFTIFLFVNTNNSLETQATIKSLIGQRYLKWNLQLLGDKSAVASIVKETDDSRVAYCNDSSFDQEKGWFSFLNSGDLLHEAALFVIAKSIIENPEAKVFYTDQDHVSTEGNFQDPFFKPNWNEDLFNGINYFGIITVFSNELWTENSHDPFETKGLGINEIAKIDKNHIIHLPYVLASSPVHNDSSCLKLEAQRIEYPLPSPAPKVSILIPTKNKGRMLEKCLQSLRNKTDYPDLEIIIIDHESTEKYARKIIDKAAEETDTKVIKYSGLFNFSAMINRAATVASGGVFILLNNDTEAVNSGWLKEMVEQVSRSDVGIVGALLVFNNETIQHAGVNPNSEGLMIHSHKHWKDNSPGYFGRLLVTHEVAAVTGACLAIKNEDWKKLGGLDEENLAVAYNDIDLCFKARSRGLKVVLTPHAKLLHQESITRGFDDTSEKISRLNEELSVMQNRWQELLDEDPAYSVNLSYDKTSFINLADPPRTKPIWDC